MAKNSKTTARASEGAAARTPAPRQSAHRRAIPPPALLRKTGPALPRKAAAKPAGAAIGPVPNFTFYANPILAIVCQPARAPALFSLELAADLTGVHPEMLRYYCRRGLLGAERAANPRCLLFDAEALREVRRIEHYRRNLTISRRALPLICELRRQAERQHIEIHFLRSP